MLVPLYSVGINLNELLFFCSYFGSLLRGTRPTSLQESYCSMIDVFALLTCLCVYCIRHIQLIVNCVFSWER